MPAELKQLAKDRLLSYNNYHQYKDKIDSVIGYMEQPPVTSWTGVKFETNRLDRIRNENVLDVVPEFTEYWQ